MEDIYLLFCEKRETKMEVKLMIQKENKETSTVINVLLDC